MNKTIDINCDLGESTDSHQWAKDAELMPYISSCNIACGGHAGNQRSIEISVNNAIKHKLAIGAHPSYPDKVNFGRKSIAISEKNLRHTLNQQIHLLLDACKTHEQQLHHIKPHGALYNDAATDQKLATIIAETVAQSIATTGSPVRLMGLAESALFDAAQKIGIPFIHEGFMDRNYQQNKTLVPRTEKYALHSSFEDSLQQALHFAQGLPIQTSNGTSLAITVNSICLHGDNPDALTIAQQLKQLLSRHQIAISAAS